MLARTRVAEPGQYEANPGPDNMSRKPLPPLQTAPAVLSSQGLGQDEKADQRGMPLAAEIVDDEIPIGLAVSPAAESPQVESAPRKLGGPWRQNKDLEGQDEETVVGSVVSGHPVLVPSPQAISYPTMKKDRNKIKLPPPPSPGSPGFHLAGRSLEAQETRDVKRKSLFQRTLEGWWDIPDILKRWESKRIPNGKSVPYRAKRGIAKSEDC